MSVCERHKMHPARIYDQCVGCEIDSLRNENAALRKALEDIATYPPFEETNNGNRFYEQMRKIAKEVTA